MALLVRPQPVKGEHWGSYVRASARHNGYADAARLAEMANVRTATLRSPSIAKQAGALGIAIQHGEDQHHGAHVAVLPLHERVCTRCLRSGVHRLPSHWNQPLTIACREHRVFLIDICPACAHPLDKFRPLANRCACGFDLRRAKADAAGASALSFCSQFIDGAVLNEAGTFSLPLQEALRLSERLRLVSQILGLGIATRAWPWISELRICLAWMDEWPTRFLEHARRYMADYRTIVPQPAISKAGRSPTRTLPGRRDALAQESASGAGRP